jgi:hypothetical protein
MPKNILGDVLGVFDIFSVIIDVALVMALYPALKGFISDASQNMTAAEIAISALIPVVLVLALVYSVARQSGLLKGAKL